MRRPVARKKLLEAARDVIRAQGYCATTVDDICAAAGVTKGAFFHHFKSKEELGVAAADFWTDTTSAEFATAPYHAPANPLDRVLAYVDYRITILDGPIEQVTCLVGTMVQETYDTSPAIRDACANSICSHAETLEADIASAMEAHGIDPASADWSPQSLALHTQAVLQGAFILAKATGDVSVAIASARHLRRYIELLFQPSTKGEKNDMTSSSKVRTCLWFDTQGEEAANFYVSLLPESFIESASRPDPTGPTLAVEFTLAGAPYMTLNGGPHFDHSPAASISVLTKDQPETDRLWEALTRDGGTPGQCGWLTDRFGVSWQIVPDVLPSFMTADDKEAAQRAHAAMLAMGKIDIAALEAAFKGD